MGSYAKNLDRRLRKQSDRATAAGSGGWPFKALEDPFEIVVPPHPSKYPKHEGSKGSVLGGICNITRCDRHHAEWFNTSTRGYYCTPCAVEINRWSTTGPICHVVDHDLTHAEMEAMR